MGGFQWCGGMKLADILQLLHLKLNVMERCNQSNKKQREISHLISLKKQIEKYGKMVVHVSIESENSLVMCGNKWFDNVPIFVMGRVV